ncbi:chymotrypsin inhibitor-like [Sitophilus oryzae]|uniref:Chymotrypsin inhibitor-like n=1 Tax=Sitophilus oryzae TaxID=7048 RepID=A0A6J2X3F7_SITOR|nr:chymotrypsin inhibitor-like [Sitophilus oryzae]
MKAIVIATILCLSVFVSLANSQACRGPHEEYLTCGSSCPPSCSRRNPGACIAVCKKGCFCRRGYLRQDRTGRCVRPSQC